MRRSLLPAFLLPALLMAQPAAAPIGPHAELKPGAGVEKLEIVGEASEFKVAPGTRIYVWAKVVGAADTTVTLVFSKGDKTSKQ